MTTTTPKCWFFINQHQRKQEFVALEQKAAKLFLELISGKDYGRGIGVFRFDIYIEPEINFGRQRDVIHAGTAQLSIHIDKATFDNATDDLKIKLLLNAALVLTKYLAQRVPLPKDFQAEALVIEFESHLATAGFLLDKSQFDQSFFKPFDAIRFNFAISTTAEVKDQDIHYDLNNVKDFINNQLVGHLFGTSIHRFDFGYEIADSKGSMPHRRETADLREYRAKHKMLLVVKQFDYGELKELDPKRQFQILKSKILEAISDVDKLSKKPTDFDRGKFFEVMSNVLTDYEKKHLH